MRVAFSKPAHAARMRIDPPNANHGFFTAKPSSCHLHVTLWVTPPTSPCPTLSADAEAGCHHAETIFSAQCVVWHYQKCTIGLHLHLYNSKLQYHISVYDTKVQYAGGEGEAVEHGFL